MAQLVVQTGNKFPVLNAFKKHERMCNKESRGRFGRKQIYNLLFCSSKRLTTSPKSSWVTLKMVFTLDHVRDVPILNIGSNRR